MSDEHFTGAVQTNSTAADSAVQQAAPRRDEFESAWDFVLYTLGDLAAIETLHASVDGNAESTPSRLAMTPALLLTPTTAGGGAAEIVTPLRFDGVSWTLNTLSLTAPTPPRSDINSNHKAGAAQQLSSSFDYLGLRDSAAPLPQVATVDLEDHARVIRTACRAIVQEATAYADQRMLDAEAADARPTASHRPASSRV